MKLLVFSKDFNYKIFSFDHIVNVISKHFAYHKKGVLASDVMQSKESAQVT